MEEVHSCAGLALTFAGLNVSRAPFWRVEDQPMLHRQPLQVVQKLGRLQIGIVIPAGQQHSLRWCGQGRIELHVLSRQHCDLLQRRVLGR